MSDLHKTQIELVRAVIRECARFAKSQTDGDRSDLWSEGWEDCAEFIATQLETNDAVFANTVQAVTK